EGNTSTNAAFTVSLSAPSCRVVTVGAVTLDGSAVAGLDYIALATNLTFLPGQTTKTVFVRVRGDIDTEPTERFSLCLSNVTGAIVSNTCGTGTIIDDDASEPPTVAIIDPPDGGVAYSPPGIIPIRAVAQDSDGVVERVDFFLGLTLVGSALNGPFEILWTNNN